jgi:hypothetical protein
MSTASYVLAVCIGGFAFYREYDVHLIQYDILRLCSSAGMLAEGQQELLHALHYSFVKAMPPSYDTGTGKFACSPS